MVAIVWFRRDLGSTTIPRCARRWPRTSGRARVLPRRRAAPRAPRLRSAHAVPARVPGRARRAARERGSRLFVRHGPPERSSPALAEEAGAERGAPDSRRGPLRDAAATERVRGALGSRRRAVGHPGLSPWTTWRDPHRGGSRTRCSRRSTRLERAAPARGAGPARAPCRAARGAADGPAARAGSLGLEQEVAEPGRGGEGAGARGAVALPRRRRARLRRRPRRLGADGTSRLSPYMHFGCVSPRRSRSALPRGKGPAAFRRQLCWRDFYAARARHFPRNARSEFQERYRGTIAMEPGRRRFEAWCEGRTGYPAVDAGMRQLRREGWMHNRARLLVGSFLTKDLGIDWRWGEALVHAPAAGRRRGQQQRQLAVDRLGGRGPRSPRSGASTTRRSQQERFDPDGATCAATCPSSRRARTSTWPSRGGCPRENRGGAGCLIGQRLPGADRGPCSGPAGSIRRVSGVKRLCFADPQGRYS